MLASEQENMTDEDKMGSKVGSRTADDHTARIQTYHENMPI